MTHDRSEKRVRNAKSLAPTANSNIKHHLTPSKLTKSYTRGQTYLGFYYPTLHVWLSTENYKESKLQEEQCVETRKPELDSGMTQTSEWSDRTFKITVTNI